MGLERKGILKIQIKVQGGKENGKIMKHHIVEPTNYEPHGCKKLFLTYISQPHCSTSLHIAQRKQVVCNCIYIDDVSLTTNMMLGHILPHVVTGHLDRQENILRRKQISIETGIDWVGIYSDNVQALCTSQANRQYSVIGTYSCTIVRKYLKSANLG